MVDGVQIYTPQTGTPPTIDTHQLSNGFERQRVALAGVGDADYVTVTGGKLDVNASNIDVLLSSLLQHAFGDAGNSTDISASIAQPGNPWVGTWTPTEVEGVVRQVTVLASTAPSGLGGTFIFEYSDNGTTNNGVHEIRPIGDFETIRSFELLNFGKYYRISFEPSRALGGDHVYVVTRQERQYGGPFVRLANQRIEQQNAAMPQTFAFLQAFDPVTGKSVNVPPPPVSGTDPDNALTTSLTSNQVWTGNWKEVEQHGSLIYLYAILTSDAPASVVIEYSNDQSTISGTSFLSRQDVVSGPFTYAVYLTIANGVYSGKYARPKVTNSAVAQVSTPIAIFSRNQYPFAGSFGALNAPLTFFSQALLVRSVGAGVNPDGGFVNLRGQGRHSANSTTVLLNGNTGGTDHIFRGTWIEWQADLGGMILDMHADVFGTLCIDFTEASVPVNGVDDDIQLTQTVSYFPSNPLFRRSFPVQSRWVRIRYINGTTAQASFGLDVAFTPGTLLPMGPLGDDPSFVGMATVTKGTLLLQNSEDPTSVSRATGTLAGGKRSQDVNVTNIESQISVKAATGLSTGQGDVNSISPLPYPPAPVASRVAVAYTNLDPKIPMYLSEAIGKLPDQADVLFPYATKILGIAPGQQVYWKIKDQGNQSTTSLLNGSTTQNSVSVSNPNNIKVSDDSRVIISALTGYVELTGFTAAQTRAVVGSVVLQMEARRDPAAPSVLTVSHQDTVTGVAANVTSVTSGSVTASSDHTYLVAISRRNASAVVSGVTGLGATWAQVPNADATGFGSTSRMSVWYNTTPVATTGAVTATFSATATNAVIGVSRFSNVDPTIFDNIQPLPSVANGTTYSGSITGTASGMAVTFLNAVNKNDVPGNGFTEQVDLVSGQAALDVATLSLAASGSQTYSGTMSGSVGWALVAVTLKPVPVTNPIIRVRYKVGTEAVGSTSLTATLSAISDTLYTQDITADRGWTFADLGSVTVIVDVVSISSSAPAQIDRVGISETDVDAGSTARLCWSEVGVT